MKLHIGNSLPASGTLLLACISSAQACLHIGSKADQQSHRRSILAKRAAADPGWTAKQDSTLLGPDWPPEQIAEAREQNVQLARQAYPNLAKMSGGTAPGSDSFDGAAQPNKRAGMPQGWFLPGTNPLQGKGNKNLAGGLPGSVAVPGTGQGDTMKKETIKKKPAKKVAGKVQKKAGNHMRADGPRFPYGEVPVRGVNLGGWLVLEPWITPSIFKDANDPNVVDEYTYGAKFGAQEAANRLKSHWDTWIVESDLATIASYGLNHVRIPIGYWALDVSHGEPYPQGQFIYLRKAIGWAQKYGLKVIIDLHGAPGSQNGFDNSGQRGSVNWHKDAENVKRTKAVLQTIIDTFVRPEFEGTVTSIELLNEPAGFVGQDMVDTTKQYYYDGYGQVRYPQKPDGSNAGPSNTLVMIHDAFQPLSTWKGFMPSPSWQDVALDTHYYSIFNENDLRMSDDDRIRAVCKSKAGLVDSDNNLWTVVGEWTPANTDCAANLNGAGVGSRFDGTYPGSTAIGSCQGKTGRAETFSDDFKHFLGRYWEAQVSVFEQASGWIQWCWKTESAHEWSYQKGVEFGWIPKNPDTRVYGDQCASVQ